MASMDHGMDHGQVQQVWRPGGICPDCEEIIQDDLSCGCPYGHCPFCDARSIDECEHLLAMFDDVNGFSVLPLDPERGPPDLPGLPGGRRPDDWTGAQRQEALGDLAPLLEAFDEWHESLKALVDSMLGLIKTPVVTVCSEYFSMASGIWADYFSANVPAARAELADLLERLAAGIARLVAMEPRVVPSLDRI